MDPTSYTSFVDDPRLQTARSDYEGSARKATEAQSKGASLPDMLREALNKKFSTSNPLVQQRESALKGYMDATTQAPMSVLPQNTGGVVYDPLQQANLIEGRRASALAPLTSSNFLLNLGVGGINDVIGSTSRAHEGVTRQLLGEAELKRGSYQDLFNELSTKAQEQFEREKFSESKRQFNLEYLLKKQLGGGTATERAEQKTIDRLLKDAKRGTTFKDLVLRYKDEIPSSQIRELYNQVNYYKKPAKESEKDIQKLLIGETAEQRNRVSALEPAKSAIKRVNLNDKALNKLGPQNKFSELSLQYLGGVGVDPEVKDLNAKFELLRQNVVRAMQGARMSDKDIEIAQGYIPNIRDEASSARIKLRNLEEFIGDLSNSPVEQQSDQGGGWEVVQW